MDGKRKGISPAGKGKNVISDPGLPQPEAVQISQGTKMTPGQLLEVEGAGGQGARRGFNDGEPSSAGAASGGVPGVDPSASSRSTSDARR